jgi:GDP-L-fucose synthase
MHSDSKIFLAGHRGLVGSAIMRRLKSAGYNQIITIDRRDLDLRDQAAVERFVRFAKPDYVFLAAARVGGILANRDFPADFIHDNLTVQNNVIESSFRNGVSKLLFLGSSCIYPRLAPQPMNEDCLLSSPLEPTNEAYAIAKIAGLKMIQAYKRQHGFNGISLMPTNLYGPGDNFDLASSHVLPALLRKFYDAVVSGASQVTVWGTGAPKREFLYVDDLADAAVFLMDNYDSDEPINVGSGEEVSIAGLASEIKSVIGYRGEILFDSTKPDGAPRKLLDCSRLFSLGWKPRTRLRAGLIATYNWYRSSDLSSRVRSQPVSA